MLTRVQKGRASGQNATVNLEHILLQKGLLLASWFLSSQALVIINYKDFQYALMW